MCGRFSLSTPVRRSNQIQQLPGYPALQPRVRNWVGRDQFVPRYNIAPSTQAPVLRASTSRADAADTLSTDAVSGSASDLVLHTMKWGLVPHWSRSETTNLSTINARAENLVEGGGIWGSIKGRKRCIVVAQGYYEWLKKGKERLPHFTRHKDGKLMLFAGLYDIAHVEGRAEPLWTFTVVTTTAHKDFAWLHDRQPVILTTEDAISKWLDTSSQIWSPELSRLLDPYSDADSPLECYPVPKEVGKVGAESPTFIEPVSKRRDGIEAMFTKQAQSSSPSKGSNSGKRKRELSPAPGNLSQSGDIVVLSSQPTSEDSDVEIVAGPSSSQASQSKPKPSNDDGPETPASSQRSKKLKTTPKTPSSPRKKAEKSDVKPTPKITSFFSPKT
ncbi:DUF159-domain-containing protein [Artomyces pyxidatus]|uniref:DUF159-domain-containing protein n=1 Tax=Artomyces pyxidatus TaxID=48021 RepID=A0ACB8T361_9AGAM|nr:DUF159-domain-containing protein [Artomyces pyxidatus]